LFVVAGLAVAAVSANATITLTSGATFSLGGIWKNLGVTPTYTANSSTSSIALATNHVGNGSADTWWFSAVGTSDLTSVTYALTVTGITSKTKVSGAIMGFSYNGTTKGSTIYSNSGNFNFNVEAATGSHAFTQTLDFTEFLGIGTNTNFNTYGSISNSKGLVIGPHAWSTTMAFYEANFQVTNVVPEPTGVAALTIGALGLLIRRRRSK
jgi:hypothetical protein